MKRLTRCCCTDVGHGATILAVIKCMLSVLTCITLICVWVSRGDWEQQLDASAYTFVNLFVPLSIAESLFGFILSGMLVYGLREKRHVFMLPYVIYSLVGFCVYTLIWLWLVVLSFFANAGFGFLALVGVAAMQFLSFYWWWVIQSQYLNVRDARDGVAALTRGGIVKV